MAAAQNRRARGLAKLRASFAETTGERRGVAPGSFVDLLVNATDKATGTSLTDLERTNQVGPIQKILSHCYDLQLGFVLLERVSTVVYRFLHVKISVRTEQHSFMRGMQDGVPRRSCLWWAPYESVSREAPRGSHACAGLCDGAVGV